jgi:hypothetical protein
MGLRFAPQTAILRDFANCVGLIRSHPEQGQEANIRFVCVRDARLPAGGGGPYLRFRE